MWHSRIRLRKDIKEYEDKKSDQKPGGYAYRKSINDKHSLAFFFIGMSLNLNLDTSLLTEKVFGVENFANITLFLYFGTVIIVAVLYMFLIEPRFMQLVVSVWLLVLSRISQLVLAILATGKAGRNLFLLFYTFNGFLRGVISLTSTFVISKHFLNSSYLHFLNGGAFFSILVSLLQMVCDAVIGSETIKNARTSLVIGQIFYLCETMIGTTWITIVYLIYNKYEDAPAENGKTESPKKAEISVRKFTYIRFYASKFAISFIASFFRVVFHPVMLPYMMDIIYIYKLVASIIFTIFEFLGRLVTFRIDEYIDPTKKDKDLSHQAYILIHDIHLYLLFVYQICICSIAIYSCWYQKFGISKNPLFITFITLTSGFVAGYTDNRGAAGGQAVMEYYSYVNKNNPDPKDSGPVITPAVASDTSNVNDILILFNYISFLTGCIISYLSQKIITRHKDTVEFIISSKKDYIDLESLNRLVAKI